MKRENYETPLLSFVEIENINIFCTSNGTNEAVEFENWN